MSSTEITYQIDDANRPIDIGGDWDAFALENESTARITHGMCNACLEKLCGDDK